MPSITLHILNSVPWSNMNRDGSGVPKVAFIGKTPRGRLSSQSIKRAIRLDYETSTSDGSIRSRALARVIAEEALAQNAELNLDMDETQALAQSLIDSLVGDGAASSWLSDEEVSAAATRIALGEVALKEKKADGKKAKQQIEFLEPGGATGSLAIAAFGRMFASQAQFNTDAAIAVSPAISVHPAQIQNDYFATVDDRPQLDRIGSGADHIGTAQYLSGVFYRTVTIDVEQLLKNWAGNLAVTDLRRKLLAQLITSIIYKLPSGKSTTTAPYTPPLVVLAEQQKYRTAYDFEIPVSPGVDGGFTENAIRTLAEQAGAARVFHAGNFGFAAIAGTGRDLDQFDIPVTNLDGIVEKVVSWVQW